MLLLAVLLLAGCGREKKIESELLGIEEKDGYTLVTVRDPWKAGQTLHRYALVPRDKPLPDGLPDATVIKVPLRSAISRRLFVSERASLTNGTSIRLSLVENGL